MDERGATPLRFTDLFPKPTLITFDEPHTSSDGGAILLHAIEQKMGLADIIAEGIEDTRQSGKIKHTIEEMVHQRIFGIACGYADGNDAAKLAEDPVMKLLAGLKDIQGPASLASQPTLSRFENSVDLRTLLEVGCRLAQQVIDYQQHRRRGKRRPKRITIDIDPTDDPTHGQQMFSFFNGYYDSWCYLPLAVFISFDRRPQQYLVGTILRPGNAHATLWTPWVLRCLVEALKKAWPKAKIRVRLDGGFAAPHIFDLLEKLDTEYFVAMAENSRLKALAEPLMQKVRKLHSKDAGSQRLYGECRYAAGTWKEHPRRVIIKAEVVENAASETKDNPRFVVTNSRLTPEGVYDFYRQRGDCENRIKELHHGLEIDRTSCTSFAANAFRVLLTSVSYMLIQALRDRIADGELRKAQVGTLRERLLKVAARVKITCRQIYVALPQTFPFADAFRQLAKALGATPVLVT